MRQEPLLQVADLRLEFNTRDGIVRPLDGVGFSAYPGETLGIVGESGSGKSVSAYSVMGILPAAARITGGRALFGGSDLLLMAEREHRAVAGRDISIIFQDARAALNPIRPVGRQIEDVLAAHARFPAAAARAKAIEAMALVRIADPERRAGSYPFELSGGMCQRVMIAMALACRPRLLFADEPTTGLDATTQVVIMDQLKELVTQRGMAVVFITHDLALAAEYCDRIAVMHAGHVVESALTPELFQRPMHPYTQKLIAATPRLSSTLAELDAIPGNLPDLRREDLPPCRYSKRCERYQPTCDSGPLPRVAVRPNHEVACWRVS